ncbi:MAG: ABC transporter permease [Betaproteobacteria bacterium HGW-Betaproteobacteria-20]|nr:MAG: ABC transporter permease [Betaproteobacteria bacterium HGW-Betaproteobacteria-20]
MIKSTLLNGITRALRNIGNKTTERIWRLGAGARLFFLALIYSGESYKRFHLIIREVYATGVMSLLIIIVSAFFVGMVLALQGYNILQKYGSSDAIGVFVSLTLVRELGPVVTALLFAGRAGTAITAEIGLMKTTEQLSAMEMMAVSPIARVIAPRFWAGVITMPILAALFSMVGVLGGYLVAVPIIGVDDGAFWSQMQANVDERLDIVDGLLKSLAFGVVCTMIALFQGYDAPPTAEGVSHATTRTVVISSLAVLALDFVLTAFMLSA